MPVVTTVERRGQFSWWSDISVAVQGMADFVRVFLMNTRQRQIRESLGRLRIESRPLVLSPNDNRK